MRATVCAVGASTRTCMAPIEISTGSSRSAGVAIRSACTAAGRARRNTGPSAGSAAAVRPGRAMPGAESGGISSWIAGHEFAWRDSPTVAGATGSASGAIIDVTDGVAPTSRGPAATHCIAARTTMRPRTGARSADRTSAACVGASAEVDSEGERCRTFIDASDTRPTGCALRPACSAGIGEGCANRSCGAVSGAWKVDIDACRTAGAAGGTAAVLMASRLESRSTGIGVSVRGAAIGGTRSVIVMPLDRISAPK